MRLWTIQQETVFERLKTEKVIHCDPVESTLIVECGFSPAYDWMAEQMKKRIGPPPAGVRYAIWAWHTFEGKQAKPDLRRSEFRGYSEPQVCMQLEIADGDVLLSNEEMWHFVLNDGYYGNAANEQDYGAEDKWFDTLPLAEKDRVKRKSWERIFDIRPAQANGGDSHGRYIQATFWELRCDQIITMRHFAGTASTNVIGSNLFY